MMHSITVRFWPKTMASFSILPIQEYEGLLININGPFSYQIWPRGFENENGNGNGNKNEHKIENENGNRVRSI